MKNICYSGGAEGADKLWGEQAEKAGHEVIHYGFREMSQFKASYRVLNMAELVMADPYLITANQKLHRSFPTRSEYVNNLLRRNYYQIKETERVYAVGYIDFERNLVNGGTGWAIQMAIDRMVPDILVFDQDKKDWFYWSNINSWESFSEWGRKPPKPHGLYTGIGSRELTDDGRQAIINLYK